MERRDLQYTITLDDDRIVPKIIEHITKIKTLPYFDPKELIINDSNQNPQAIFLDINLSPGISGLDYIEEIKSKWPLAPLFIITSDTNPKLISTSLAIGAQDFIKKPFVPEEVSARFHRRISEMALSRMNDEVAIGDCKLHKSLRMLDRDGIIVYLDPLETRLLEYLALTPHLRISKDQIRSYLWIGVKVTENSVDKKISTLRQALKKCHSKTTIKTYYGGDISLEI